jgi:hypothetical protein
MDWKVVADGTDFHKAKDVAAFANHLGGTLLIGAKETNGHLEHYVGMDPADASSVRDKFSKAVKDRCEPLPRIDFEEYSDPNDAAKKVIAVNVWPSLLLIGVRITAHKPTENYGGDSYVLPVRSGTDADYLTPNQIAMYMTPQVRRVAVLISRIPKGSPVTIWNSRNSHYNAMFEEIKEDENLVMFKSQDGSRAPNIPLDCIKTVYEAWEGTLHRIYWRMYVDFGVS